MQKFNLMLLLLVGALHPAAVVAEDAGLSGGDNQRLAVNATSTDSLQLVSAYPSRWQLRNRPVSSLYSSEWSPPFADVAFQDSGTLARVSRLRNLSLLTFAEVGRSRLFLGVNDEGLVGLHFRAFRRQDEGRYLEVARMPYLKESETDDK